MPFLFLLMSLLIPFPDNPDFYAFKVTGIDGQPINLADYKGKKILIVNTASECGYTPQYKGLQELAEKYKDKLVVIGFPANNFGGQEPGTNEQIESFCSATYKVTFPMSVKVSVKGNDIDPLFFWLLQQPNPDFTGDIKWNFEKFLIDENGVLIHRFRTATEPTDPALTKYL